MSYQDQILLMVVAAGLLQIVSLIVLPKWWKLVACPTLIVMMLIAIDLTNAGNLSGIITQRLLGPLAIGYLVILLILFGLLKLGQKQSQAKSS